MKNGKKKGFEIGDLGELILALAFEQIEQKNTQKSF